MIFDVFVSYSSIDKTIADTIVSAMEANHIRCWYAPRDIKPGEDWGKAISSAIEQCKVFLIIFSENSNRSQRVLDEVNLAISHEIPILPFRIENIQPDGAMRLHLSSRHWLDAYSPSWESHIKKLISTVSSNLETTITEEDVEFQESSGHQQKTTRSKGLRNIAAIAMVIFAGWYGLTRMNILDGETPPATLSNTEWVDPTLSEKTGEMSETATLEQVTQEIIVEPCRIAFYSALSGNDNLWLMEPNGSNLTQLSFNKFGDAFASWSPDGSQIVFNSGRDGDDEIYIMNADGANIRQLTDNDVEDYAPVWSPDGEQIVFFSGRDGDDEIYIMNADGANIQQLTDNDKWDYAPDWSPDGGQIVFVSEFDKDAEIFIMDADGSNLQQLTSNEYYDSSPKWSPDGEQIVFVSDRYGDKEIFVMNNDGTNIMQLTSNNGVSIYPDWAPGGSRIVFASNRDGDDLEIWVMDADGSNQLQITLNDVKDLLPVWSPLCN
ncbi:TIR domain-containing protein [Chloroflexota bacterium]